MRSLTERIWSWLVVPLGLVGTGFYAILVTVVGRRDPASPLTERVLRAWARMWIVITAINLVVEGGEDLDPTTSYVVVSNHLSNYDIMICLVALPVPIRFLAKKELFGYPLLSSAMRAIGCVEVDRGGRARAIEAINRQAELVRSRNHSLMVYAEGTRSRDGAIRPFKKGAFALAAGGGLPVVPVGISGTFEVVRPGSIRVRRHQTVKVRIGSPIQPSGHSVESLRDETFAAVRDLIA